MRRSILRNERQKKNLTMKNVSHHVGIEMSHYAKIEHGTSNPSLEVACRLEKFFNIPVCTLLKRDGDDQ